MPNFQDWVRQSPQNANVGAELSQLAMKYGLTPRSTPDQLFAALKQWTAAHTYNESADDMPTAIRNKVWNCVSLSRLLVVAWCMLKDHHPNFPAGVQERRVNTRKLSAPGIRANIASLLPNVGRQDSPGEHRYTFSGHTWVVINGTEFDLLMGASGPGVGNNFPVEVAKNPEQAFVCSLRPPLRAPEPPPVPPRPGPPGIAHGPGYPERPVPPPPPVPPGPPGIMRAPVLPPRPMPPGPPPPPPRPGAPGIMHAPVLPPRPAPPPPPVPPRPGVPGGELGGVQYWMRGTGGRIGPLPAFELVRV